jgi:CRISPR-associated protein Csy1
VSVAPESPLARARAAFAQGDFEVAQAEARRAVELGEPLDDALVLLANASIRRDDLAAAVEALERLVARHPGREALRRQCSVALNNLGSRQIRRGETKAATEHLVRALAHWPGNADAHFNRARIAIEARQFASARESLARALALRPDDDQFALELAETDIALGDADALPRALEALSKLGAGSAPNHARLAAALADAGGPDAALAQLRRLHRAEQFDDVYAGAKQLLGNGHHAQGRAAFAHGAALGRRGEVSRTLLGVIGEHLGLPDLFPSHEALRVAREQFALGMERLLGECGEARLRRLDPRLEQLQWTNFLLAYHGENDKLLYQRYGVFLERALRVFAPHLLQAPKAARTARPRIGLLSSAFRYSTAGSYFASWVSALTEAGMDTTVFQLGPYFDDYTESIGAKGTRLVKLTGDIAAAADAVRDAALDLLILPDAQVDGRLVLLSAMRLAPRQLAAWGHPVTTGLGSIDGFLTCAEMEPPDAAEHYSEPLLPLPGVGTAYLRPAAPAPRTRAELGLPERRRLYYVPQSHFKVHPDSDAVFARIAALDPEATLVFYCGDRPGATRMLRQRLSTALAHAGAAPDRQLLFLPLTLRSRFLEYTAACDVMVDCLHWSGGNTTLDALHCGLPVLTCPGRFMRGRQSYAMLRLLGIDEGLVAPDAEALADQAVALATDPGRRASKAAEIRARLPDLMDGSRALAALVEAVRQALDQRPAPGH